MSKKIIILILLNALIVLAAACQNTPDDQIVIIKSNDALIEAAEQNNSEILEPFSLEAFNAPEKINLQLIEGNLQINVNADIIIPDVDAFPIVRVEGADFSQELTTALFNKLCGNTIMYTVPTEMTKSELEDEIVALKQLLNEAIGSGDTGSQQVYTDLIAIDEAKLLNAPDSVEQIQTDGTLMIVLERHPEDRAVVVGQLTGLAAMGDNLSFKITNNSDRTETISYVTETGGGGRALKTMARFNYKNKNFSFDFDNNYKVLLDLNNVNEQDQLLSNINLTPDEAVKYVEDFLEELDIPMMPSNIYFYNNTYEVNCCRTINGVPCAIIEGAATGGSTEMYAPFWFYERLAFYINDNGLLRIEWESPLKIMDTVVGNCNLLPFSDIQAIFETMMTIIYEYEANQMEEYNTVINIDRIELTLVRVSEQNSITTGLLVPAWRFYGSKIIDNQTTTGCWLTVNAVDGSVIDTTIGY